MKKILVLLLIIATFSVLSACRPSIRDHTLRYGIGPGWYHEGKSPQEMEQDFDACRALAREHDNDPAVENDCMKSKGYILK